MAVGADVEGEIVVDEDNKGLKVAGIGEHESPELTSINEVPYQPAPFQEWL